MESSRSLSAVVLLAVSVLGVVGCGSSSSAASPTGQPASAARSTTSASALVVYSAQGYDKPVTEAFTKATGIPAKLVDDSTGPPLTKVAAERNNPQWDVLWVDGATAFAALDKHGQLAPTRRRGHLHHRGGPLTCSVTLQPEGRLAYPAHQGGPESTTSAT